MKALITGASSGLGYDMAIYLSKLGYDLIIVARRIDKLNKLKNVAQTKVKVIKLDLSKKENCYKLYETVKNENIDILINNAGFGDFGEFYETNLDNEINMINTNIVALHILTKLFIKDMIKNDKGYILNVSSSAAFAPGPLMATYYSTKSYVFRLSQSIISELKHQHSNVNLSILCPGPVKTEFNKVANVEFSIKALKSSDVAIYAINKMFKKKTIIIPGMTMKISRFLSKIMPDNIISNFIYLNQKKKERNYRKSEEKCK